MTDATQFTPLVNPPDSIPHDQVPHNEPSTDNHRTEVTQADLARGERLAILLRNGYRPTEESDDEITPLDVESYGQSAPVELASEEAS